MCWFFNNLEFLNLNWSNLDSIKRKNEVFFPQCKCLFMIILYRRARVEYFKVALVNSNLLDSFKLDYKMQIFMIDLKRSNHFDSFDFSDLLVGGYAFIAHLQAPPIFLYVFDCLSIISMDF